MLSNNRIMLANSLYDLTSIIGLLDEIDTLTQKLDTVENIKDELTLYQQINESINPEMENNSTEFANNVERLKNNIHTIRTEIGNIMPIRDTIVQLNQSICKHVYVSDYVPLPSDHYGDNMKEISYCCYCEKNEDE